MAWRLISAAMRNGKVHLPPDNTLVNFDDDGISDEVEESVVKATVPHCPGYDIFESPDTIPGVTSGISLQDSSQPDGLGQLDNPDDYEQCSVCLGVYLKPVSDNHNQIECDAVHHGDMSCSIPETSGVPFDQDKVISPDNSDPDITEQKPDGAPVQGHIPDDVVESTDDVNRASLESLEQSITESAPEVPGRKKRSAAKV